METFFTADLHLWHGRIIVHAGRPFSCVEEMVEALVANWNSVVPVRGGLVHVLGDLAWRNHAACLGRLNGAKILYLGSHDRMSPEALAMFREVHVAAMAHVAGRMYWCAHACHRIWERSHYGVPHLFGHSHGRLETFNLSMDVGVDACGPQGFRPYCPIHESDIEAFMGMRRELMESAGRVLHDRPRPIYLQDDVAWLARQAAGPEGEARP